MYKISKIKTNGEEYLPDVHNTQIFTDYESNKTHDMKVLYELYDVISKRENYLKSYEKNKDTSFEIYKGLVMGILIGAGYIESSDDNHIYIKKGSEVIMVIEKIAKDHIKEIIYRLAKALPMMTDFEKGQLLGMAESYAKMNSEKNNDK